LGHALSPFCFIFQVGLAFAWVWSRNGDPPTSAFLIAEILGVYHHAKLSHFLSLHLVLKTSGLC
jgi:hypothetical protein